MLLLSTEEVSQNIFAGLIIPLENLNKADFPRDTLPGRQGARPADRFQRPPARLCKQSYEWLGEAQSRSSPKPGFAAEANFLKLPRPPSTQVLGHLKGPRQRYKALNVLRSSPVARYRKLLSSFVRGDRADRIHVSRFSIFGETFSRR